MRTQTGTRRSHCQKFVPKVRPVSCLLERRLTTFDSKVASQSESPSLNYPVNEVLYPRRTEKEVPRKTTNTINTLPDDVLLAIFDHYRSALGAHSGWCQIWYTLAHVCRRWKELVLTSSRRLDVQLRCTFGTHAE